MIELGIDPIVEYVLALFEGQLDFGLERMAG